MRKFKGSEIFGAVDGCESTEEVAAFMRNLSWNQGAARRSAAAYAMTLIAANLVKPESTFYDGQEVLNQLSRTKAELDIACGHDLDVAGVTSTLLNAAQKFVDEMTIPCTEWATTEEIFSVVYEKATKFCA